MPQSGPFYDIVFNVRDVQNIPTKVRQSVQLRWKCGNQEGNSNKVNVESDYTAPFNYKTKIPKLPSEDGKVPFLNLFLELRPMPRSPPQLLDEVSLYFNGPSDAKLTLCTAKRVIFNVEVSVVACAMTSQSPHRSRRKVLPDATAQELEQQLEETRRMLSQQRQMSVKLRTEMKRMAASQASSKNPSVSSEAVSSEGQSAASMQLVRSSGDPHGPRHECGCVVL